MRQGSVASRRGGSGQPAAAYGCVRPREGVVRRRLRSASGFPVHSGAVRNVDERCRGGSCGRPDAEGRWRDPSPPAPCMPGFSDAGCAPRHTRAPPWLRAGQHLPCGCGRHPQPCSRSGRTPSRPPPPDVTEAALCSRPVPGHQPGTTALRRHVAGEAAAGPWMASGSAGRAGAQKAALRWRGWRSLVTPPAVACLHRCRSDSCSPAGRAWLSDHSCLPAGSYKRCHTTMAQTELPSPYGCPANNELVRQWASPLVGGCSWSMTMLHSTYGHGKTFQ